MAIKKSDLYSSLWASCDALQGGISEREKEHSGEEGVFAGFDTVTTVAVKDLTST